MRHPLTRLRGSALWAAFVAFSAAAAVTGSMANRPPDTARAPWGIVSLQLAGSRGEAEEVIASWRAGGLVEDALLGLQWDAVFLLLYPNALALLALAISGWLGRTGRPGAPLGVPAAWALWAAGVCDAVEDVALWSMLRAPIETGWTQPWAPIATWFALGKFTILGLVIQYLVYAAVVSLFIRGQR